MKLVIQRVDHASVSVDEEIVGEIKKGFLILICFEEGDDDSKLQKAIDKVANLRLFDDQEGKINLNISQVSGEILSVSQFTLSWDGTSGHRPSFEKSMAPQEARLKYALFNKGLRDRGLTVKEGRFGAFMKVSLANNGPVTILLQY